MLRVAKESMWQDSEEQMFQVAEEHDEESKHDEENRQGLLFIKLYSNSFYLADDVHESGFHLRLLHVDMALQLLYF